MSLSLETMIEEIKIKEEGRRIRCGGREGRRGAQPSTASFKLEKEDL